VYMTEERNEKVETKSRGRLAPLSPWCVSTTYVPILASAVKLLRAVSYDRGHSGEVTFDQSLLSKQTRRLSSIRH
jgi:hypothetical protein